MLSGVGTLIRAFMLASVISPGPAFAFESYSLVKQAIFDRVFASTRKTLYCQCPFDHRRRLDLNVCGYSSPGNSKRATRVEIEHVVPASWIGRGRACWHEKICKNRRGQRFKGRKCCLQVDAAFRSAYQDLHNLWPTVGEVNERRRNYAFGLIDGERRNFGSCDIEIDRKAKSAEPRPDIRGDIARINLYMAKTHHIHLSADQYHLFQTWHRADPPDQAERRRNRIIKNLQGNGNPFVDEIGPATAARRSG